MLNLLMKFFTEGERTQAWGSLLFLVSSGIQLAMSLGAVDPTTGTFLNSWIGEFGAGFLAALSAFTVGMRRVTTTPVGVKPEEVVRVDEIEETVFEDDDGNAVVFEPSIVTGDDT